MQAFLYLCLYLPCQKSLRHQRSLRWPSGTLHQLTCRAFTLSFLKKKKNYKQEKAKSCHMCLTLYLWFSGVLKLKVWQSDFPGQLLQSLQVLHLMGSCNAVRHYRDVFCSSFCFCSLGDILVRVGRWKCKRVECARLWDRALRIWVDEGMCMVRSSFVVCCAWKTRCGGKVGLMQQSLTSEDQ